MSSDCYETFKQLPKPKLSDMEFWFNSVDLILSTCIFCDNFKCDHVKTYLKYIGYGFLVKDLPQLKKGQEYDGLRKHVFNQLKKWDLSVMLDKVSFFRCIDLKPSAFLHILNKTFSCDQAVPKSITRTFLLARLPRHVQRVMVMEILLHPQPLDERSPNDLAAVTDGIVGYVKYHSIPTTNKQKITLPKYVASDPELWFYSLDEAFSSNGVTDDQLKFEYTMDALPEELLATALFLTDLPNQPVENKYANLRERVIKTFALIQSDDTYRFVFRNMTGLRPKSLLQFMNNLADKSSKIVTQLLVRTFWIMLLPIQTQAVLFQLLAESREPLQDLDMNAMVFVAEGRWRDVESNETMETIKVIVPTPELNNKVVDKQVLQTELLTATSLQQKIALGMKYCDFMYRIYYEHNPSESIEKSTVFKPRRNEVTAEKHYFFEGCTCKYHEYYGETATDCTQVGYEEVE